MITIKTLWYDNHFAVFLGAAALVWFDNLMAEIEIFTNHFVGV